MKDLDNHELRLIAVSLTMFKSSLLDCGAELEETSPVTLLHDKVMEEQRKRAEIEAMAEATLPLPFPFEEKIKKNSAYGKFANLPPAKWQGKKTA